MTADRFYPARPFLAASVAVFRNGKVLLASRGKPPWENQYSLPGGQVETGETLAEAALRELHEEVGVTAALTGLIAPFEVIERGDDGRVKHHVVIAVFAARWLSGEPRTGPEARDVRWVTEPEIASLSTTPGLPGILEQAFAQDRRHQPA
ncbi:NUDIX hydrolase [Microvirga antarctica]|uniref:NUDIX hydrolase n=1 Tax=Microvirga antarctica TaxID=2819233 RepID=UPI001B315A34|nr:NUDIX hydrolase [Microvirga antarctica]